MEIDFSYNNMIIYLFWYNDTKLVLQEGPGDKLPLIFKYKYFFANYPTKQFSFLYDTDAEKNSFTLDP